MKNRCDMWGILKALYKRYREIISYLFWGVVTTLINLGGYFCLTRVFCIFYLVSSITSWIIATIFSFFVNKFFVFHSTTLKRSVVLKENIFFILSRVFSCLVDLGILYIFVNKLFFDDFYVKIFSNAVAVVLNYAASKWIIFKKE